jgi:alpha-galactosidase
MPALPNALLRTLYVPDSLRHTSRGLQFALRNRIAAATLPRVHALEVDDISYPLDRITIALPGHPARPAPTITPAAPLLLPAGTTATVHLEDLLLQPGLHRFALRVEEQTLGQVEVEWRARLPEGEARPTLASRPPAVSGGAFRPIKVAILGAGSAVFARRLMADLLCTPGLEQGTFALVDIDAERLELARRIGEALVERSGKSWTVEAATDRRQALPGCDYVIHTIEVAGLRNVRHDYDIPHKYGVDQCIGDTIGPGGVFKMLRTGPAWLAILRDLERLCPQAVVMNYTNPLSALTLLALRATPLTVVGLCHSVQSTSRRLAAYLQVPYEELRWQCAGINHLAWFTELTHRGVDLYPRLRQVACTPETYEADPVRFEVLLHFGAFVTESSGHFSEYVPYFRKRPDVLERYTRAGYLGQSGFYADNWPRWRAQADASIRAQLEGRSEITLERSTEYASVIVEAIESSSPAVVHGNVRNASLIDNLPTGGCVEVPVLVDGTGLHPLHVGPLPPQLAALDAAHMYVHELLVRAVLERDRDAALHALLLDPLTAAVCSPAEIRQMFDEMWAAQREDLAAFDAYDR